MSSIVRCGQISKCISTGQKPEAELMGTTYLQNFQASQLDDVDINMTQRASLEQKENC